jgi:hypothetical protein
VLPAALFGLAILAVYGRALGFDFVYDDRALLLYNQALADPGTLWEALTHDLFHFAPGVRPSPYWRPVVTLSYYLDHRLGGGGPTAYHATNLLVLWGGCVGLYRWLLTHSTRSVALAAAVLFAFHPMQVEAAVNISARTDLFCAVFCIWALSSRNRWACLLWTALAVGSKEIAIVLPVVAWILAPGDKRWRGQSVVVLGWLALRFGVLSQIALLPEDQPGPTGESAVALGAQSAIWLSRLFIPRSHAPGVALPSPGLWMACVGWAAVLGVTALGWRARKSRPRAAASVALMVLPLLPVSGLVISDPRYGEGFLSLPLVGFSLGAALFLPRQALWALVLVFGTLSWLKIPNWQDEASLWTAAHERAPEDPSVRLNLARTLVETQPERSLELLSGVGQPDPRRGREASAVRAQAFLLLGDESAALPELLAASGEDEEAAWATATACLLLHTEGSGLALETCALAARIMPEEAGISNALGIVHALRNEHEEARARFENAVALEPGRVDFEGNLAQLLAEIEALDGEIDEGAEILE